MATISTLLSQFASMMRDTRTPPLWSTQERLEYAADAEHQVAARLLQLVDMSSPMTELAYAADAVNVPLDPRIIKIDAAWLNGREIPVGNLLQARSEGFDPARTAQHPQALLTLAGTHSLRLYPIPAEAGTVTLCVRRYPLVRIDASVDIENDEVETDPRLFPLMLEWMAYRAYSKRDPETYLPELRDAAAARFDHLIVRELGMQNRLRTHRHTVRCRY